jgi:muramidase (phage lysozyme)
MSQWESVPVALDGNTKKFLDFLGQAEGADYNTIVGGGKFEDYQAHPNVVGLRTKEGPSTAAGKYQITNTTYKDVASKLGINDFSPESQDRIALELIKRGGALEDVQKGDYNAAIGKLGKTWASLPSSPYSQPKKSQSWVEKTLDMVVSPAQAQPMTNQNQMEEVPTQSGGPAWEDVPKQQAEFEDVPRVTTAAPKVSQEAPKRTTTEELGRQGGLTGRYALQGAEKAFTFPVRAVGEAVGSGAEMLGLKDAGGWIRQNLGMGSNAGAQVANALDLPKPVGGVEKFVGGASELLSGLGVGNVVSKVPGAVENVLARTTAKAVPTGAPTTAQQVLTATMPAPTSTASTAVQAGLGGAMEVAPVETAAALALVTAGKAGYDAKKLNSAVNNIVKNAGNDKNALMDAEIIKRMGNVASDPTRFVKGKAPDTLSAETLNQAVTKSFLDPVRKALNDIPKSQRDENYKALSEAVKGTNWNSLSAEARNALRGTPQGDAVADAIEKAIRSKTLTSAVKARGGVVGNVIREGLDRAPATIASSMAFGIPVPVKLSSTGLGQRLLGRQTREDVASNLLTPRSQQAADVVLNKFNTGSPSTLENLQNLATKAKSADAARVAALKQNKAQQAAEILKNKNEVLGASRMPLGGAFQELLPGGKSGLNLNSADAIDALRVVSQYGKVDPKFKGTADAARQILKSGGDIKDTNTFYGVQNLIRRLSEEGKIVGKAAPASEGILSSGIRNPISYEANVKNATEAAKLAREAAPTPSLGIFASKIAGTKSPADKLALVESRLAKATDPAEIEYLNKMVMPLTKFGKK